MQPLLSIPIGKIEAVHRVQREVMAHITMIPSLLQPLANTIDLLLHPLRIHIPILFITIITNNYSRTCHRQRQMVITLLRSLTSACISRHRLAR